jgi:hypothetical protein
MIGIHIVVKRRHVLLVPANEERVEIGRTAIGSLRSSKSARRMEIRGFTA